MPRSKKQNPDELADNIDALRKLNVKYPVEKESNKVISINNNKNLSNNNEEDFENEYAMNYDTNQEAQISGRLSGGSHESAFSSQSDSSEEENGGQFADSSSDQNYPSSGRSSSNRDHHSLDESLKILNGTCNIAPETSESLKFVDNVRVKFLNSLQNEKELIENLFNPLDIEELRKPILFSEDGRNYAYRRLAFRLITRYINFSQLSTKYKDEFTKAEKELDDCVASLRETLKFRQQYHLSEALPDSFTKEFYVLSGIFPFGYDKFHVPVLYLRARVHRRWTVKLDDTFRRYVAWQLDLTTKSYHGAKVEKTVGINGIEKDGSFGICFDCLRVSYSCLDMDFLRFLVKMLVHHYPSYCRYALCVDLPWLFRSVWKLVRSWLPEEAQNSVQLITAKQLTEFIDEDQIPNSIKFDHREANEKPVKNKHSFPKNWESLRGIDDFGKDLNLSASEIKQFKDHVESVRKEYEQLGAL